MKPGNGDDNKLPIISNSSDEVADYLGRYAFEGKWKEVIKIYYESRAAPTTIIKSVASTEKKQKSVGTALHMAVDLDEELVVRDLVNAILTVQSPQALETKNEGGDTPLHVAASRGFARICKWIIGRNNERIYLANLTNKQGETPLFQAAINWKKQTFAYLSHIWNKNNRAPLPHLVRTNGDTILHCAIRREYFDLAVIIVHYYDSLSTCKNKDEETPLKVLATRPSAFQSSTNLPWWKRILYHCIHVEPLDAESEMEANLAETKKHPNSDKVNYLKNYTKLLAGSFTSLCGKQPSQKNQLDAENPSNNEQNNCTIGFGTHQVGFLPPNYETILHFVKPAGVCILRLLGELKELDKTKKRHQWGDKLFKALMKRPYEAYMGTAGVPTITDFDLDAYNIIFYEPLNRGQLERLEDEKERKKGVDDIIQTELDLLTETNRLQRLEEEKERKPGANDIIASGSDVSGETIKLQCMEEKKERKHGANDIIESGSDVSAETKKIQSMEKEKERKHGTNDKKESELDVNYTTFLVAAGNGIAEMVNEILSQIPSVIHETSSREENVLLVAVKNRKPLIVENLKTKLRSKREVWNALTLGVDEDGKTMLHLAAYAPEDDKPWQISGSALQMMWDVNWFQYIKSLVPQHFYLSRSYAHKQTAMEIFKEKHKELRKESSEWLRETSESCSVVAALVAGVSFATASTVPGGNDDNGMPHLEGKPAFDAFVIASLFGLCFSVTGLIMFLTILTSRKLHRDFGSGLPLKLLLGLSSLFVSIVALLVSFCTGHSFLLSHKYKKVILPIYAATFFPITIYAVAQLPLYFDLLAAILVKVPKPSDEGDSL
ncbi:Ankyrin repeat-containing protein [Spatholobus suberectus]|nr:Ankyrin repeat-containing protein [Spatholobus suberectus]